MSEYTKILCTFRERVLFLFTGLLKNEHVISKDVGNLMYTVTDRYVKIPKSSKYDGDMNNIPFFDLDKSDTKSNL